MRASRKVRRWANLAGLGRIRYVESSRPPARFWIVWAVIYLPLFVYFWFDCETVAIFAATVAVFLVMMVVVGGAFGGEKLVVLDRGIIVGSFLPFVKPYVIPFSVIDPRTVRRWTATTRPLKSMTVEGKPDLFLPEKQDLVIRTRRTTPWSRQQVSFVGLGSIFSRRLQHGRPIDLRHPLATEIWVFTANTPERQYRTAQAICAALRDAGAPGVEVSESLLGTSRQLRASVADADYLAMPSFWRRPAYRSQQFDMAGPPLMGWR